MGKFRIPLNLLAVLLLSLQSAICCTQCRAKSRIGGRPSVDLEDYIDSPKNKNRELLGTSATGYYGHGRRHGNGLAHAQGLGQHGLGHGLGHVQGHLGHGIGHQPQLHHHQQQPYHHGAVGHHHQHPVAYHPHGHHNQHHPYNYGHAQSYLIGEYGHVGSAHVSFGTEINHAHSHQHHHHSFYG